MSDSTYERWQENYRHLGHSSDTRHTGSGLLCGLKECQQHVYIVKTASGSRSGDDGNHLWLRRDPHP